MIALRRVDCGSDGDRETDWPPQLLGAVYFVRHDNGDTLVNCDVKVSRWIGEPSGEWRAEISLNGPHAPTVETALAELGRWLARLGEELQGAPGADAMSIPVLLKGRAKEAA